MESEKDTWLDMTMADLVGSVSPVTTSLRPPTNSDQSIIDIKLSSAMKHKSFSYIPTCNGLKNMSASTGRTFAVKKRLT